MADGRPVGDGDEMQGYRLQGEHYHDKGAGDLFGTENYGDIKAEEGKEETGSSRSQLPYMEREYSNNYENNNHNNNFDQNIDVDEQDNAHAFATSPYQNGGGDMAAAGDNGDGETGAGMT